MPERGAWFQRLGTLPAYANSSPDDVASAEIAAATGDGRTLVYTDSPGGRLGLVELDRLGRPRPAGTIAVPGEPTSVAVLGHLALTVVDTSARFTDPSGVLQVLDLRSRQVVATHDLRGQPDSVDLSPDGRYAAVAIENERDEDVNDGQLPQLPGGHLAVVDLRKGEVVNHFPAGEATVEGVDTVEDGEIRLDGTVTAAREPDGVAWVDDHHLATADEGDLQGGSRTWTVFDSRTGAVVFSSGAELERLAVRYGQYPEFRAEDKGVEPEGVAVATYHGVRYAFIGMERANLVAVYRIGDPRHPRLVQALPTGVGPEGLLPLPQRDGLVVASEEDVAADQVRAAVTTYRLTGRPLDAAVRRNQAAPTIVSADDPAGDPIGFGALSGLSGVPGAKDRLVAVTDNAYTPTRVLGVDAGVAPAVVDSELPLTRNGISVGYDAEGVAARKGGGFWLVSEGDGEATPNLLVEVDGGGRVLREAGLPAGIEAGATANGFEGVAVVRDPAGREQVWVAVQREWADNPTGQVTLARYTPATGAWAFAAHPLDAAPPGGTVGLSELTALDDDTLLGAVDNDGLEDAPGESVLLHLGRAPRR